MSLSDTLRHSRLVKVSRFLRDVHPTQGIKKTFTYPWFMGRHYRCAGLALAFFGPKAGKTFVDLADYLGLSSKELLKAMDPDRPEQVAEKLLATAGK